MRLHSVDGYAALKHPAPGNPFSASERRHESKEAAVFAAEFPAVPAGAKVCVETEQADTATDSAAMEANRKEIKFSNLSVEGLGARCPIDADRFAERVSRFGRIGKSLDRLPARGIVPVGQQRLAETDDDAALVPVAGSILVADNKRLPPPGDPPTAVEKHGRADHR